MFKKIIKRVIKRTVIGEMVEDYRRLKPYFEWLELGKPVPPPKIVKQMTIKFYANKFKPRIFVESGTYLGEMVDAVSNVFGKIYSVELSDKLYEKAKARFSTYDHISILRGDSAKVIKEILDQVNESCLFWLDGHYSGEITVKGETQTPVMKELTHIFDHSIKDHVIIIDDARCFTGQNDYPAMQELRNLVLSRTRDYRFEVKDDIIRIHESKI